MDFLLDSTKLNISSGVIPFQAKDALDSLDDQLNIERESRPYEVR